jgi:4-aminobutyrate aminotransferase/(S)-3-amino-2-methylpropionate transaminase
VTRPTQTGNDHIPSSTGKTIFCNSGFEAVEAALKTACRATGRAEVIAFEGGYHGLGYGALNVTHRDYFKSSFRDQLKPFTRFLPFPQDAGTSGKALQLLRRWLKRGKTGAVLLEPIQGRGGLRMFPPGFVRELAAICRSSGVLLIADEVFSGFGRSGKWFACEWSGTTPDLICLGKALTGGFPLSACVGRAELMDQAWPRSEGEALHTSTFLGHPVGCAMALAQIAEIERLRLVTRTCSMGEWLGARLETLCEWLPSRARSRMKAVRTGIGLLQGITLTGAGNQPATREALTVVKRCLADGLILLPEGEFSNVLGLTPPLTIRRHQLEAALEILQKRLARA